MADQPLSPSEKEQLERMHAAAESGDLFALLGLPFDAPKDRVQEAFYEVSRTWHPDRFFRRNIGAEEAERIEFLFATITDAYKTLSDEVRRAAHVRDHSPARPSTGGLSEAARRSSPASRHSSRPIPRGPSAGSSSSAGLPPPPSYRPDMNLKRTESAVVAQMRAALQERLKKARTQFEEGKKELAEGNVMKASAALQLASSYDPQNEEYAQVARQAQAQARKLQSKQFVTQAEAAESYQNLKDALAWYRKAVEYGTEEGKAHYRAAMISRKLEPEEKRAQLDLLRNAVRLSPGQPDFHLALGQLYAELDMRLNARRELEAVLKVRKDHAEAREALKRLSS